MSTRRVNRKKLNVIDGGKQRASSPIPTEDLPSANGAYHGQHTRPTDSTDPAEFTAALFFWPLDVLRWWMPRSIN